MQSQEKYLAQSKKFQVKRVKQLGLGWGQGQKNAQVISQDGGYSNIVDEGSLWWFGDTFLGTKKQKQYNIKGNLSCSLAFLSAKNFYQQGIPNLQYLRGQNGIALQGIALLEDEDPQKIRLWPLGAFYLNDKFYCFYNKIKKTGQGAWDFKIVSCGLAYSGHAFSQYKRLLIDFPVSPAQVIIQKQWAYFLTIGKQGKDVYLARVNPSNIEEPDAYQFYTASKQYSKDKELSFPIVKNVYGQLSVTWNQYLSKYILVQASDFSNPLEITLRKAQSLQGPWIKQTSFKVSEMSQGQKISLIYCCYLHPELFRDKGKIMVMSYSINMKDRWFDLNNQFIEVQIEKQESEQKNL